MDTNSFEKFLKEYTEEEKMYRSNYENENNHENPSEFLNHLYTQGWDFPELLTEEALFQNSTDKSIMLQKHSRYTPPFLHQHLFFEAIYVLSGSCTQIIADRVVTIEEGDLCIISPEVTHAIYVFDESIVINTLIKKSTFNEVFFEFLRSENVLSVYFLNNLYEKQRNQYFVFHTKKDKDIKDLYLNMYLEYLKDDDYSTRILNNFLMIFFAILMRRHRYNIELPKILKKDNSLNSRLLHYIQKNYNTVTLESIANEFNYTQPYISKLIKNETGSTFTKIVQVLRLERACLQLENTNLSISEISNAVGYPNPEHFIRLFKSEFDITPSGYRKRERKNKTE